MGLVHSLEPPTNHNSYCFGTCINESTTALRYNSKKKALLIYTVNNTSTLLLTLMFML